MFFRLRPGVYWKLWSNAVMTSGGHVVMTTVVHTLVCLVSFVRNLFGLQPVAGGGPCLRLPAADGVRQFPRPHHAQPAGGAGLTLATSGTGKMAECQT